MTRVSVLVPCYNHADYVEAAIGSALDSIDRAGVDGEVRVLDDGSSDDSLARLRSIDDARLRVEAQRNAGAHVAFNRLLDAAAGDIVFLLNSDDLYAPDRIRALLRLFDQRPQLVAAGSWLEIIDGDDKPIGVKQAWHTLPPWPKPRRGPALAELGDAALALLETNYLATTSNIAFRRSALEGPAPLRFANLRYCHDWDFFLGLARRGPLEIIDQPLARYRVHQSNTLRETEDRSAARMRFEILWLLARHAAELIEGCENAEDLRRRLWFGLPHFGAETLLLQLLAWREAGDETYEALLDLENPLRLEAEELLEDGP